MVQGPSGHKPAGKSQGRVRKVVICPVAPKQTLNGGLYLLCPLLLQEPPPSEEHPAATLLPCLGHWSALSQAVSQGSMVCGAPCSKSKVQIPC